MNADGTAPIYLRITIDGQCIEVSSKRNAIPSEWNASAQKLTGTGEQVRSVNEYLKTLEHQVYEVHRQMIEKKLPLTAANLKMYCSAKKKNRQAKRSSPCLNSITEK